MSPFATRRQHPRVILDQHVTLCFRAETGAAEGIPLVNLGPGGCCLRVPASLAGRIKARSRLTDVQFEHAGLLLPPVEAEVVYLLGEEKAEEWGFFLVGLAFQDTTAQFRMLVEGFLDTHELPARAEGA